MTSEEQRLIAEVTAKLVGDRYYVDGYRVIFADNGKIARVCNDPHDARMWAGKWNKMHSSIEQWLRERHREP